MNVRMIGSSRPISAAIAAVSVEEAVRGVDMRRVDQ